MFPARVYESSSCRLVAGMQLHLHFHYYYTCGNPQPKAIGHTQICLQPDPGPFHAQSDVPLGQT